MSVKQFVLNCLDKGMTATQAWHAAREQYYPLRIVGWGYVQKLAREYKPKKGVRRARNNRHTG